MIKLKELVHFTLRRLLAFSCSAPMSLFASVPLSPPDPVFQTKAAYEKDADSRKINLGA